MLLFVIPYIIIIYSLRKEVDIMNYISVKAASEKWGISERRIQKLCEENRIDGTEKFGRAWMIPKQGTNRRRIMEFNEKLQQLRTGKNLTQEQLAEQLYVSRTAISKWESGKGYPNIESLKCISKFFSVTIDELLSGEELITLAETENRSNLKKIYSFIYGILDMMAVTFILLPLYGNLVDGYIYSVNLLSFTDTTPIYLAIYWIVFIVLIALGIAKLMCVCFEKESWSNIITKCSLVLSTLFICFFAAARQPYVTALMFLLFVAKIFVWIKQTQTK